MPNSYSETADITCSRCQNTFPAELWFIVDAGERPDLIERARDGALHGVTCPRCGDRAFADAPVLIHRPGAEPVLVFFPADRTTPDQDRATAHWLVGRLRSSLGDGWQDDWLAGGLRGLPRTAMPAVLNGQPIDALQPADPLVNAARQFVSASDWAATRQIAEANPVLLSDEADALMQQMVDIALSRREPDAERLFSEHRDLLRRCREVGIEQAFAEKMAQQEAERTPPEQRDQAAFVARVQTYQDRLQEAAASNEPDVATWTEIVTLGEAMLADEPRAWGGVDWAALRGNVSDDYTMLGNAHDAAGDGVQALAAYDRAVALEPGNVLGHRNRAGTLIALGRLAEAGGAAARARELEPEAPELAELDQHLARAQDAARGAAGEPGQS